MISNRLKKIASLVPKDKRVIDVGCDHGLLGIYLYLYNSNQVVLSDISINCINKSLENLKKYDLEKEIKLIQSDGLEKLEIKTDDIIIIAGMGTNTILNILNKNISNDLIIQTNNNYELLRKKMTKKNYYIEQEIFFEEKNINYIVMYFKQGKRKYTNIDYIVGPILKHDKKYLKYIINKYSFLLKNIPKKYILKRLKIKKIIKKIS